mgnify:CR=1 FL=1
MYYINNDNDVNSINKGYKCDQVTGFKHADLHKVINCIYVHNMYCDRCRLEYPSHTVYDADNKIVGHHAFFYGYIPMD